MKYKAFTTEQIKQSAYLDEMTTGDMLRAINNEDKKVASAVEAVLDDVAKAVDAAAEKLRKGGRLFYLGAGTSGRLGVADAAECPPTYGCSSETVQALMIGGRSAVFSAAEGEEDDPQAGVMLLKEKNFGANDVCIGISASGSARSVCEALSYVNATGGLSVALACNPDAETAKLATYTILPVTGPEAVAGSTRMKAGTAQKMVLNMISTGIMIKLGRVYHNMMIYMNPSNKKLRARAIGIVSHALNIDDIKAEKLLIDCGFNISAALKKQ